MLNLIWVFMIVGAVVCAAVTGQMTEISKASTDGAKSAVELAIGLVGVMAFWLGMMRILQQAGLLKAMAKKFKPLMRRLFPDIPSDHPALSMMVLNISSNMLGLGNAATPFGLKAMMELDTLNKNRGVATNSMSLFLAINTSGLAVLPTGMIAMRASLGAVNPGSILVTTIAATLFSTIVAILSCKIFERLPRFSVNNYTAETRESPESSNEPDDLRSEIDTTIAKEREQVESSESDGVHGGVLAYLLVAAVVLAFGYALYQRAMVTVDGVHIGFLAALSQALRDWPLVILLVTIVLIGHTRGVKVYDAVIDGGKEGFNVAIRIIPYLVAIMVAVAMLRASGAIGYLVTILEPITSLIGMPAETMPMALLRTLSGSGAFAVSADIMQTYGPDSLIGNIAATMQGSTETTFYVLALYFGVVGIKFGRHTLLVCLLADAAGAIGAVWACRLLM